MRPGLCAYPSCESIEIGLGINDLQVCVAHIDWAMAEAAKPLKAALQNQHAVGDVRVGQSPLKVTFSSRENAIKLTFDHDVEWIEMNPQQAAQFALELLRVTLEQAAEQGLKIHLNLDTMLPALRKYIDAPESRP